MAKLHFSVRWYYQTGCGAHYLRITKNGSTFWNQNKAASTAYDQTDHHVMDVKKNDRIKVFSNRSATCVGGSGITDILTIKDNIQAKSVNRFTNPVSRVDISSFGTQYIEFDYLAHVGNPNGAPTYLETLDKMDQWTSAQYIPKRNQLNL